MAITAKKIVINKVSQKNDARTCILKVLAYFDIFQYPLTGKEINQYLAEAKPKEYFEESLQQMIDGKHIFLYEGFYSLHDNPLLAHRRKEGNLRAEKLLPMAFKIGRFLYHFPFVRAVGVSGSLSKNFADEKADIDFFIITNANRLWIARTIMHVFKKLTFITGQQHYFCMNYYIDEETLLIEDQNIFTAIEIATLVPVSGKETLDNFFAINKWCCQFFPGCRKGHLHDNQPGKPWIKRLAEWLFDNTMGDYLDKWLLKITTRRWQQKSLSGKRNKNGLRMELITGKHFARSNPGAFQEKVLALYEQKLTELKLV